MLAMLFRRPSAQILTALPRLFSINPVTPAAPVDAARLRHKLPGYQGRRAALMLAAAFGLAATAPAWAQQYKAMEWNYNTPATGGDGTAFYCTGANIATRDSCAQYQGLISSPTSVSGLTNTRVNTDTAGTGDIIDFGKGADFVNGGSPLGTALGLAGIGGAGTTFATAKAAGDYVEYTFTTSSSLPAGTTLSTFAFGTFDNLVTGNRFGGDLDFAVEISANGFATAGALLVASRDYDFLSAGEILFQSDIPAVNSRYTLVGTSTNFVLAPSTTYTFRVYVFNSDVGYSDGAGWETLNFIDDISLYFDERPQITLQKNLIDPTLAAGSTVTFNYTTTGISGKSSNYYNTPVAGTATNPAGTSGTTNTWRGTGTPVSPATVANVTAPPDSIAAYGGNATGMTTTSVNRLYGTGGTGVTVTETPLPAGYAQTAWSCVDTNAANSGNPATAVTGTTGAISLSGAQMDSGTSAAAGPALWVCTVTNVKLPTVTVTKISNGGVDTFGFTGTNGFTGAAYNITTVTSGVAVSGPARILTAASTATTITEAAPPAGFALTGITCIGLGAGGTATATINGTSGGNVVLNAAATAAGSNIACTFTNARQPILRLQKQLPNGRFVSSDQFTLSIAGTGGSTVTTSGSGTTATGTVTVNPATIGSAYTFSETGAAGAILSNYATTYACTNILSGGQASSGSGTSFSLTPGAGDDITCTFVNTRNPLADLSITKTNTPGTNGEVDQSGDTVIRGTTTAYSIVATNNGPDAVTGAVVRDPAQVGLACNDPVPCTGSGCPAPTVPLSSLQTSGVVLGTVANGATVIFTLSCTVQ